MGYFDYLEESVTQQREAQFFDAYAKKGFWIGVGAFCALIATIVLFCFVQAKRLFAAEAFAYLKYLTAASNIRIS